MELGMKLGLVGTGAIGEAIVRGLCGAGGHREPVFVTARTQARSARLAAAFPNVRVLSANQAVVDASDWVVLAVRPEQARDVASSLRFRPEHRVISLVAGLGLDALGPLVAPASRFHRANPLPFIEHG